jgi:hypothetical protein
MYSNPLLTLQKTFFSLLFDEKLSGKKEEKFIKKIKFHVLLKSDYTERKKKKMKHFLFLVCKLVLHMGGRLNTQIVCLFK